jgi:hypothetical protein
MALVTREDQAYADANAFVGTGAHGLETILLAAGWTLFDTVDADPDEQDKVFHSAGEDGNQEIFLRMTNDSVNNRVHFRTYSFWNTTTQAGYHETGDDAGATCIPYPAVAFDAWVVATADHLALVIDFDGGTTYNKFFGGLLESSIAPTHAFNGRLGPPVTNHNSAGDDRLRMALGTDYSDLEADQYLWVVNQSSTSYPGTAEKVQVSSYDAPTETIFLVAPLTDSYIAAGVVSLQPQEVILWGSSTGQLSTSTPYALHSAEDYGSQALAWTSILDGIGLGTIPSTDYGEYPLAQPVFYDATVDQKNLAGTLSRIRRATSGSAVDEDEFTVDTDRLINFSDGGGYFALQVT